MTDHSVTDTKRHYSLKALHEEYKTSFSLMMKVSVVGVVGAVLYFMVLIVFLGAKGHTPIEDYAKQFLDRYPVDYVGLKTPAYGGSAEPTPAHHE